MSKQVGRAVGAVSLSALAVIFLGCMSLSFGGRNYTTHFVEDDGVFCQQGDFILRSGEERTVYYPIPYASPPNLNVGGDFLDVTLLEQKPDSFRVCCKAHQGLMTPPQLRWKARGVRRCVTPPQVMGPPEVVGPPPPTKLPELPPPVEQPKN